MRKLFIETIGFTERLLLRLDDDDYTKLQKLLMQDPERGSVMPGCGGLRKLRLADPKRGKGKRGGLRIIYLHVPEADWLLLLDVYDKGKKEDLSQRERAALKRVAEAFKSEAIKKSNSMPGMET